MPIDFLARGRLYHVDLANRACRLQRLPLLNECLLVETMIPERGHDDNFVADINFNCHIRIAERFTW
jgi:hypothetical protein